MRTASTAVIIQAIGLASYLEAERAAASLAAAMPNAPAFLDVVLVADAPTAALRPRPPHVTAIIDVAALVPAPLARRVEAAGRDGGGACRRRSGCRVGAVRALRAARIEALSALLRTYATILALDSDTLVCAPLDALFARAGASAADVLVRPAAVAVAKGAAARAPPSLPEPNGGFLVLRNTSATRRTLARWRGLYGAYRGRRHPTSDQPLLRAAIHQARAKFEALPRVYGCPAWCAKARACPTFGRSLRRAVDDRGGAKLAGPNAALWRAHLRAIDRDASPCVAVHGVHVAGPPS